jgi:hypothetical protein
LRQSFPPNLASCVWALRPTNLMYFLTDFSTLYAMRPTFMKSTPDGIWSGKCENSYKKKKFWKILQFFVFVNFEMYNSKCESDIQILKSVCSSNCRFFKPWPECWNQRPVFRLFLCSWPDCLVNQLVKFH